MVYHRTKGWFYLHNVWSRERRRDTLCFSLSGLYRPAKELQHAWLTYISIRYKLFKGTTCLKERNQDDSTGKIYHTFIYTNVVHCVLFLVHSDKTTILTSAINISYPYLSRTISHTELNSLSWTNTYRLLTKQLCHSKQTNSSEEEGKKCPGLKSCSSCIAAAQSVLLLSCSTVLY